MPADDSDDEGKGGMPASSSAATSMPATRRPTGVKVSVSSDDTFSGAARAWEAT